MDRSEAREWLLQIKDRIRGGDEEFDARRHEAIDMAIKALDDNKCLKCLHNPEHPFTTNKSVKANGSDLISRQDAIDIVDQFSREEMFHYMESLELDVRATQICHSAIEAVGTIKEQIASLPSAEPREYGVLCALADRTCPFQGKEIAWCLTCPHISEEDRDLLKKAISEPKTGEWILEEQKSQNHVENIYICSSCKNFEAWGKEELYNYCPNCGARMLGEDGEA